MEAYVLNMTVSLGHPVILRANALTSAKVQLIASHTPDNLFSSKAEKL